LTGGEASVQPETSQDEQARRQNKPGKPGEPARAGAVRAPPGWSSVGESYRLRGLEGLKLQRLELLSFSMGLLLDLETGLLQRGQAGRLLGLPASLFFGCAPGQDLRFLLSELRGAGRRRAGSPIQGG